MRPRTGFARLLSFPLSACLCLAILSGIPAWAETLSDKSFNDWQTCTVAGQHPVFDMSAQGQNSSVHLGKFLGQCGGPKLMIVHRFANPSPKDFDLGSVSGEVRVDQQPVHSTVSRLVSKTGQSTEAYYVNSFSSPQTLLEEMSNGQTIRFRFMVGEQEYYYHYSLNGFQPAFTRISQMCAQGSGGEERRAASPRREAAQKPKAGKSDSDYFPGNAPQETKKQNKSDKDYF